MSAGILAHPAAPVPTDPAAAGAADAVYFPGLVPTPFASLAAFLTGNEHARRLLPVADEVLGYRLLDRGRDADIYDWEVFETAHVLVGLALARGAERVTRTRPIAAGGQSFGAITAAVHAGVIGLADAVRLIVASTREEIAYFESLSTPVGTLFFYRLTTTQVTDLAAAAAGAGRPVEVSVHLDNLVHAVCGTLDDLEDFAGRVRRAGGHVFYRMNRSEHCRSLDPLRLRLEQLVYRQFSWRDPQVPLISDVHGGLLPSGSAVMTDLLAGWVTPVHWSVVADGLTASGARRILVVGPPSMFTRLIGRSVPTVEVSPRSPVPARGRAGR